MKDDLLLPGWRERIASAPVAGPALPLPPPLARDYLAGRVHLVQDSGGARTLVQAAYESPVTCIGIDTEYRFISIGIIRSGCAATTSGTTSAPSGRSASPSRSSPRTGCCASSSISGSPAC